MRTPPENEDAGDAIPPKLAAAFDELARDPVFVPAGVEDAILKAARRHLGAAVPRRASILRFAPWLAAAAAVVLLAGVIRLAVIRAHGPAADAFARRADLDENGRVDVLDAFRLARNLRDGGPLEPRFDVNDDGVIDQRDIDAIAARALRLEAARL